ncbi:MAG: phosphate ABC transporter permease subunit PstC [Hyphomicrobiales bacterium]
MAIEGSRTGRPFAVLPLKNRLKPGDWVFTALVTAAAAVIVLVIFGLFWELTRRAWPSIREFGLPFIWETTWDPPRETFGAGAFIVGTGITSVVALVLATLIGVLVALFLVEIAPRRVARPVSYLVELLAAIPSVVYGLWGIFVLGTFIRDHLGPLITSTLGWIPFFDGTPLITGIFSACIILTVMILPTVMAVSRDVIAAVPNSQREGVLALGATRWEMIRYAVLPYARSGILGAAILGLARAVGETLAVTLVIGNRVGIPNTIFDPAYTMASVIANQFTEVENDMHRAALIEVALLLLVITFFINVGARLLVWRVTRGRRIAVVE